LPVLQSIKSVHKTRVMKNKTHTLLQIYSFVIVSKNYQNQSRIYKGIVKLRTGCFFLKHNVH